MSDSLPPHGPPGSYVHGILQARILGWKPIPLSRGSSGLKDYNRVSYPVEAFFIVRATRELTTVYPYNRTLLSNKKE